MATSFQLDVRPLFRDHDISCMAAYDILLSDYAYMSNPAGDDTYPDHANAQNVLCHLRPNACTPRMPMNGPYWSDQQLALFAQWMQDGYAP
jgi:hypothetical protein